MPIWPGRRLIVRYGFQIRSTKSKKQVQRYKAKRKPTNIKLEKIKKEVSALVPVILVLFGAFGVVYFSNSMRADNGSLEVKTFSLPTPPTSKANEIKKEVVGLNRSVPINIKIVSVGIDYRIKQVGKNTDGSMETPGVLENITGWYKFSPTPGEVGPAIIVGHVDSYEGPSVFWRLREVKPGEVIEIMREDGKNAKFRVDSLKQFDQANFPTTEVYGNVNNPQLRLITCGGTFNKTTGQYTANTVVFASYIK